jgi:hypothetical protein
VDAVHQLADRFAAEEALLFGDQAFEGAGEGALQLGVGNRRQAAAADFLQFGPGFGFDRLPGLASTRAAVSTVRGRPETITRSKRTPAAAKRMAGGIGLGAAILVQRDLRAGRACRRRRNR